MYLKALTTMMICLIRQSGTYCNGNGGFSKERIQRMKPTITTIDLMVGAVA